VPGKHTKKSPPKSKRKRNRDIERNYPLRQFIEKLRRFADALEIGTRFSIQIHQERVHVPARAVANIEHEREGDHEEIEFQLKWRNARGAKRRGHDAHGARPRRSSTRRAG
jgi:amphi-Trp domain-containing protein